MIRRRGPLGACEARVVALVGSGVGSPMIPRVGERQAGHESCCRN